MSDKPKYRNSQIKSLGTHSLGKLADVLTHAHTQLTVVIFIKN